jgi:hypothetical protein
MDETLSLEWSYTPADFFEAPVDYSGSSYTVHIESGRVVATFTSDQPDSVFPDVHEELEARFLGAQVVRNRSFQLSGYNARRTRPDGTAVVGVSASITAGACLDSVDFILRDAAGNITFDSKAERIKATEEFGRLASKHQNDPVAQALLKSYSAAMNDPSNELTHLYEIRDALKDKFGRKETKARSALGISRENWKRLGKLADYAPLRQGRHRGKHIGQLRDATEAELAEARAIARDMIEAYLRYLG